jgi:hypothetical protein
MHARDPVSQRDHAADFGDVNLHRVAADLISNDLGDFFRSNIHINPDSAGIALRPRLAAL